ncbi:Chorion class high-cysteine HCB protein 13, partial [Dysosmobacter welbionis]
LLGDRNRAGVPIPHPVLQTPHGHVEVAVDHIPRPVQQGPGGPLIHIEMVAVG